MKKYMIFSVITFLLSIYSCKKVTQLESVNNAVVTEEEKSIINQAKTDLQNIIPQDDLKTLNWNNAVFVKSGNEITVTIEAIRKNGQQLVYYTNGIDKMYNWNGNVHFIGPQR